MFLSKNLKYEVNCPKRIILQRLNVSVKPPYKKCKDSDSYDLEGYVGTDSFEVCFNNYYIFENRRRKQIRIYFSGKFTEKNGKTYIDIKVKTPVILYVIFIPLIIFAIINLCYTYITENKILESLLPILTMLFGWPFFGILMKEQVDNTLKVLENIFKECDGLCSL